MFANSAEGEFMDSGNFRNPVLCRLAKELELPELTFQVIRRSIVLTAEVGPFLENTSSLTSQSGLWCA